MFFPNLLLDNWFNLDEKIVNKLHIFTYYFLCICLEKLCDQGKFMNVCCFSTLKRKSFACTFEW